MTEQEAMQNAYGTSGWRNSESVFNSGWKAALEWAKSQQEPVAWLWPKERGPFICTTKTELAPDFNFWDKTPKPVYTHPAPAPDVSELVDVLTDLEMMDLYIEPISPQVLRIQPFGVITLRSLLAVLSPLTGQVGVRLNECALS